ncbi:XdhC family protein [Gemmatimonadales bacterium]|nr:XdhC family protein [Gemmatimonadales bacterium]
MTYEDDKTLSEALRTAQEAGRACALATIVATRGSTPRKVGARMVIDPTTGLTGTVGGGCGEAEVIESAYRVLETGFAERVRVDLTEDFTTWSPAVCGGVMDIFVEVVEASTSALEQSSESAQARED